MRTHINKALKTRCRAIQNALKKYNAAAAKLGRPALEWSQISHYGSIAEFELLRDCREDIRKLPWADSKNRQASNLSAKLERAREERPRLDIEVQRLATWLDDEEQHLLTCIEQIEVTAPTLSSEIHMRLQRRLQINDEHRRRIQAIYSLPSYTGSQQVGRRVGRPSGSNPLRIRIRNTAVGDAQVSTLTGIAEDDDVEVDASEDRDDELDAFSAYLGTLAVD